MNKESSTFTWTSIRLYAMAFLFYTISYTTLVTIPFYASSIGASKADIGMIMGASMFVSMFLRPVAGKVIDRYGAKLLLLSSLFLFVLSLSGYFVPSIWVFGGVRLIYGFISAFFSTAMTIMVISLFSEQVRGQALSIYTLTTMLPATFSPTLALVLKDHVPFRLIFLVLILIGCINLLIGWTVYRAKGHEAQASERRPPVGDAWKNPSLLAASLTMMTGSLSSGAILTFLALYLEGMGSTGAHGYFFIQMATLVFCRFFGRKLIPSDNRQPRALVLAAATFGVLGTLLLSAVPVQPYLSLAAVSNGIAFAVLYPTLVTFVSFSVPAHARGLLLGVFSGVDDLGSALGAFAMGMMAERFSYSAVYAFCSFTWLCGGVLFIAFRPASTLPAEA